MTKQFLLHLNVCAVLEASKMIKRNNNLSRLTYKKSQEPLKRKSSPACSTY